MSIYVAEPPFKALQGEGRFIGEPSVFLRLFGCNLRCPGFNMPAGEKTTLPIQIARDYKENPDKYKNLSDFPVISEGCDTYLAVYPEFRSVAKKWEIKDLVKHLEPMIWALPLTKARLVVTGGEPLLPGNQKKLSQILYALECNVTFETNGTQLLTPAFSELLRDYAVNVADVHFSVSPKLSGSGHTKDETYNPAAIASYTEVGAVDLKFVIDPDKPNDMEEIQLYQDLADRIYLMPQGGTNEVYAKNMVRVANMALETGNFFSPRLQCQISDNDWGT